MNKLLKSYLLQNKLFTSSKVFFLLAGVFFFSENRGQTTNYITNGSFEELYNCTFPYDLRKVKGWLSTDSSSSFSAVFYGMCNSTIPFNANTYQFPRSGNNYAISNFYYPNGIIGYLKNRLRKNLEPNKTYCVKFYTNICNTSTYGMDGFGIYFGDNSIDTITKNNIHLTYLNPQVKNPSGNIISDTLNWVPVTGTFVANGTEKFALIGNFLSEVATTTSLTNPTNLPLIFTDLLIDDVSCIDIDLPAFAGRDTTCITGNTVYIGRPRDVGIDEACTWYQLPNMNTVIATAAGLTVSPNGITSYVVRQEICGNVKWDTVTVTENPLGISGLDNTQRFKIYPAPASDHIQIEGTKPNEDLLIEISDMSGRLILNHKLKPEGSIAKLDLDLRNGVYLIRVTDNKDEQFIKKLLIAK